MVITGLDVGTTKVTCFIARREGVDDVRIIGIGHEAARGMKAGIVTDLAAAEQAIRRAVERAERMAETRAREVYVSLSGGSPESRYTESAVSLGGQEIDDDVIQRAFDGLTPEGRAGDRDTIHAIPIQYEIDGARGIRNPRGMTGRRLGVRLHLVSVTHGALRNLITCLRRLDLEVAAPVVAGYASGLACLVEDELDLGVAAIDMGGGTTSLAIFSGGALVHAESFPIGGWHVTNDIARGLSTPIQSAEQVKRLYASAIGGPRDARELIEVPQLGEDLPASSIQVPRTLLVGIVRPRLEEIFELLRDRLDSSGFADAAGRRVVITGGASQIEGIRDLAGQVLEKQIRLARPLPVPGLAHSTTGPEYAAATGLLIYAGRNQASLQPRRVRRELRRRPENPLGRIGHWLKENF
ncbi:MAG: cell division protein FtsA [Alphaproteobacteria bacterium]